MTSWRLSVMIAVLIGIIGAARPAHAGSVSSSDAGIAADAGPAAAGAEALNRGYTLVSRKPPDLVGARAAFTEVMANGRPDQACEASYKLAEMDEQEFEFARALEHYERAVTLAPSSRYAARSQPRISYLRSHAEGGFAPLAALERVRRNENVKSDRASIDDLAREADGFPPGPVRNETRFTTAQLYKDLKLRDEGLAELRKLANDPTADPTSVREASRKLFEWVAQGGDLKGGVREAEKARSVDPSVRTQYALFSRRILLHRIALTWLAIFGVLTVIAVVRAAMSGRLASVGRTTLRFAPWVAAFSGWIAYAGGGLAEGWEMGNAAPFRWLAVGIGPVALLSRTWAACSSASVPQRAFRALVALGGIVAVAYLALEHVDASYLESFHL